MGHKLTTTFILCRTYGVHKAQTLEEWTSTLDLATRWEFTSVRALAIRSIQTLTVPPADCIALCHKYDIADSWTTAAYVALCERIDPLTITEANKLGMEAVVHVVQIRERLRAGNSLTSYGSPTRSAARRQEVIGNRSRTGVTGRSERLQWDIGKSFLDQTQITPPRHIASSNKSIASKSSRQMPVRSARLVAEAFGLPLGSQR
ncbi:hypothetical protein QCA50_005406 [Cerrena zonata]|uniref:Uncharacterized protein n=1 Tax=Cerrena zonata TaxID=2478898 RepID=A0AAW0GF35_9APHY